MLMGSWQNQLLIIKNLSRFPISMPLRWDGVCGTRGTHRGWSRLGTLVRSGCLWEGCWLWLSCPADLPAPGMFPSQQPVPATWLHLCGTAGTNIGAVLGKDTWTLERATPGHESGEGLQGILLPCFQHWSCWQVACMFEKSKPGFLQTHGVHWRAPPCQPLAQVAQMGQGAIKWSFHLTSSPNAPSPWCVGWEWEEEDPNGMGIPRIPSSQLHMVIWLMPDAAWVWTGNAASLSGHTNHTVV